MKQEDLEKGVPEAVLKKIRKLPVDKQEGALKSFWFGALSACGLVISGLAVFVIKFIRLFSVQEAAGGAGGSGAMAFVKFFTVLLVGCLLGYMIEQFGGYDD